MKITKEYLKSIKACSPSVQKFINTFGELEIPEVVDSVEVKDQDLFNDVLWLIRNTKIKINKIVCGNRIYQFQYDEKSNIIKEINPYGDVYQFQYDDNDNLIKKIFPSGKTYQWEYDEKGNLIKETDFEGRVYQYEPQKYIGDIKFNQQ